MSDSQGHEDVTDRGEPAATDSPSTGPADRLRWDDSLTRRRRFTILRSPIRLLYAGGAATMFIGALMPWAEGLVGFLPVKFGGFDGASDGLILAAFSIVALVFAWSDDLLHAVEGPRRWAPLILGLLSVGIWLLGFQSAQMAIRGWEDDTGHGSMVIGYWLTGVGVAIVAAVGSYATLRHHDGQRGDPLALVRRPRRSDAAAVLGWVGGIAGLLLGAWVALQVFPPISVAAPMLFLAAIGLFGGAYVGRAVGNAIARSNA